MKNLYSALIITVRDQTVNEVTSTLKKINTEKGTTFKTHYALDSNQVLTILEEETPIDIAFLDFKLPPEPSNGVFSAKDVGIKIRRSYPKTSIVVVNALEDPILLKDVSDSIIPEGFFMTGEMNTSPVALFATQLLLGSPFYSKAVSRCLTNLLGVSYKLDSRDVQLLRELDKGYTLGKIGELISISSSAVAKRKIKLKVKLGVPDGNDRDLIKRARILGYMKFY